MEMLSALREAVGLAVTDTSSDALLASLLARAESFGRRFCHLRAEETMPDDLLVRMAAEDYGRLDGAGLSRRTLSGAAETYLTNYGEGILSQLRALRHPAGRTGCGC